MKAFLIGAAVAILLFIGMYIGEINAKRNMKDLVTYGQEYTISITPGFTKTTLNFPKDQCGIVITLKKGECQEGEDCQAPEIDMSKPGLSQQISPIPSEGDTAFVILPKNKNGYWDCVFKKGKWGEEKP